MERDADPALRATLRSDPARLGELRHANRNQLGLDTEGAGAVDELPGQREVLAAERCVATASGVFRIFSDRSAE